MHAWCLGPAAATWFLTLISRGFVVSISLIAVWLYARSFDCFLRCQIDISKDAPASKETLCRRGARDVRWPTNVASAANASVAREEHIDDGYWGY